MKAICRFSAAGLLTVFLLSAAQAGTTVLNYNLLYAGSVVGKQTVKIEKPKVDGRPMTRVMVSGKVNVRILIFVHAFEESLDAYFDGDRVHKFTYRTVTNGKRLAIKARAREGKLDIETDRDGVKERKTIAQRDYDFNSWSTYLTPDRSYTPKRKGASRSVKMLILETAELRKRKVTNEGVVTISCLGRPQRALRLKWDKGRYCNYSWQLVGHGFLPGRFVCGSRTGKVTFELTRLHSKASPASGGYARR